MYVDSFIHMKVATLKITKYLLIGFLYTCLVYKLCADYDVSLLIPWQIAVVGLVMFFLQFSYLSGRYYHRLLRARKIWNTILENSHFFKVKVAKFLEGEDTSHLEKEVIHRHLAWLVALRLELISKKPLSLSVFEDEIDDLLSRKELESLNTLTSISGQILRSQANKLQQLQSDFYLDARTHMELFKQLQTFYSDQVKSEDIRKTPYLRRSVRKYYLMKLLLALCAPFCLMSMFTVNANIGLVLICSLSALLFTLILVGEKIIEFSRVPGENLYSRVPLEDISSSFDSAVFVKASNPFAS